MHDPPALCQHARGHTQPPAGREKSSFFKEETYETDWSGTINGVMGPTHVTELSSLAHLGEVTGEVPESQQSQTKH